MIDDSPNNNPAKKYPREKITRKFRPRKDNPAKNMKFRENFF